VDNFDGGICGIANAEYQLKFGIVLLAVAAKALPDFWVDTFQGLEDGNRGELG
jgi:hypothetical protein